MTFSICHTSARPQVWRAIYDAWLSNAVDASEVEYILVCDRRWGFTELPTLRPQDKVLWNEERRCYVDGVNIAARAATGGILIVNADDQFPCAEWDLHLLQAVADKGGDESLDDADFVIEVSTNTPTEHERGILVIPILSRGRYDRFGWVLFPSFESMFADNDFCAMARRDGVVIDARHLVFPHKHPLFDNAIPMDDAYRAQNRAEAYRDGERIFKARQAINFAGVPPAEHGAIQITALPSDQRRIVATCTPGDTFSMAWMDAWSDLLSHLLGKYNVFRLAGYTSDVGMTRTLFAKSVAESRQPLIEYVLWIDDDNTLTFEQFEMLMADLDAHPELDAVVGWCWILRHELPITDAAVSVSCGHLSDIERTEDGEDIQYCRPRSFDYADLMAGSQDVKLIGYSGFPVVLMRAELLRKAGERAFLPMLDKRFQFGRSGEDLSFFARAGVQHGAKFAVDRRVQVPHLKLMPAGPSQDVIEKYLKQAVKA